MGNIFYWEILVGVALSPFLSFLERINACSKRTLDQRITLFIVLFRITVLNRRKLWANYSTLCHLKSNRRIMPLPIFVNNRSISFKFLSMLIRREIKVLYLCVFIAVDMKYQINVPHSCSTKSPGCHDTCEQRETVSHFLRKRVKISPWLVPSQRLSSHRLDGERQSSCYFHVFRQQRWAASMLTDSSSPSNLFGRKSTIKHWSYLFLESTAFSSVDDKARWLLANERSESIQIKKRNRPRGHQVNEMFTRGLEMKG